MEATAYRPSGLTPTSFMKMQLGAGAFYTGVDSSQITADTTAEQFATILEEARIAGKSLGATTGGGTFVATPEVRQIEVDDLTYPVIGSTVFDSWEIMLTTTIKEITKANLQRVLSATVVDAPTGAIMISSTLLPEHYIPFLGWAGITGEGGLIYIEIQNALNTTGMTMTIANMGEATIPVEFRGHQSDLTKMQYAPCKIFFFEREAEGMTDAEKLAADRAAVEAATFEIPSDQQSTQAAKTAWVQGAVSAIVQHSTVVVSYALGAYQVTLSLGSEPNQVFNIDVTEED